MNMIESMTGAADTQDEVVETHSEKSGAFIGGLAGVVAGGVAGLVLGGITGAVTGGGWCAPRRTSRRNDRRAVWGCHRRYQRRTD